MALSKIIKSINPSSTMVLAQKTVEMRKEGIDIVDLTVGEPDFPTPANIKKAAVRAIQNNFTKYTINSGIIELRKAIAAKFQNENGLDYDAVNIVVSNGAKQSIFNTILSIVEKGDEVIIPAPYYVSYPEMVKMARGIPIIVEGAEESGFKITAAQLEAAITTKTKLFILCNPVNPTGALYGKAHLEKFTAVLENKDIYVLADEIYEKFVYDGLKFTSFASLSQANKNKTIIINGVSKSYSMTGWRIGYAAGPEDVMGSINKIQSHSTSNASSVSQMAAFEALTGPQESIENMRIEFEHRRNFLLEELNSIAGIKCIKPEGAFYLFPNIKGLLGKKSGTERLNTSSELAMFLLNEARLAAVPGEGFGADGYLRLAYTSPINILKEGIMRLTNAVGKLAD